MTIAALMSPWLLGVVLFVGAPLGASLYLSFTRYDMTRTPRWVGLENYRAMLHDPTLHIAVMNTLWLVVVVVPVQILAALATAVLLNGRGRGRSLYRTIVFLPSVLPGVAATLAFVVILRPGVGPVDRLIGLTGLPEPLWFNDPRFSKPALLLLSLWSIGPTVVIYLAGMLAIPRNLYEVAMLEGAARWRRFRTVTLPLLRPVLVFTVVTSLINAVQFFTEAYVAGFASSPNAVAPGEPMQSTLFYPLWLYQQAFVDFRLGYASAMAWVLLIVTVALCAIILRRYRSMPWAAAR